MSSFCAVSLGSMLDSRRVSKMSASEWPPTTSLIDWMVDWIAVVVVGERAAPALSEPRAPPPPPPAMPAARGEIARTHAGTGERVVVEALAIAAGIASNDARPWVSGEWVWVLVWVQWLGPARLGGCVVFQGKGREKNYRLEIERVARLARVVAAVNEFYGRGGSTVSVCANAGWWGHRCLNDGYTPT